MRSRIGNVQPTSIVCIANAQPPSEVAPRLWQSGFPINAERLYGDGFSMIVLCAEEMQPAEQEFPGVEVVYAPMSDSLDEGKFVGNLETAQHAARQVARALEDGRKVLVTCAMGRNRSSLVTGLALIMYSGISGREAARKIRAVRKNALTNDLFSRYLEWKKP